MPLGIIPAGSGNDYAWYTLKLPRDPAAAVERAFEGRAVASDAGSINGRYFVNAFSVGLDADVAVAAGRLKKYPFMSGQRLYLASILRQVFFGYQRSPWLTLSLDGRRAREQRSAMSSWRCPTDQAMAAVSRSTRGQITPMDSSTSARLTTCRSCDFCN